MACGGCMQMRHMMVRLVLGTKTADKLVPGALVYIQPVKPPAQPKETVIERGIIIKAKPRG